MFRTIPALERPELGFAEAVLSAFAFLTGEYGFHLVRAEPTFVRYESPDVFVNVYHGRSSYELGVELGQLTNAPGEEERPFSISEVIDLTAAQEQTGGGFLQASTAERIKEYVPRLARLVKEYAWPALRGNPHLFRQLAAKRAETSEKLLKEWRLSEVRKEAEQAWREKNYTRLAELYESLREELTPAEAKKLEYAKRHS